MELADETLCALAAQGDPSAEEILVARYHRLVRSYARPYFLAGGDGEDLIQEGMLGLLQAVRQYQPGRKVKFQTFAEICIRNRLFSTVKAATRRKHIPLINYISFKTPSIDESADFAIADDRGDPETLYIQRESHREQAERILEFLSGFEAEILGLYLAGLSYSEIASAVHRPTKSVDNAVQRIRRKLVQHFSSGDFSRS